MKGFKSLFWLAALFVFLVSMVALLIQVPLTVIGRIEHLNSIMNVLGELIHYILTVPVSAGLLLLGVRYLQQKNPEANDIFKAYRVRIIIHLLLMLLVIAVIVMFFMMLAIVTYSYKDLISSSIEDTLVCLFIAIFFVLGVILFNTSIFAQLLILDQRMNFWRAFCRALKVTYKNFWRMLWFSIYILLIGIVNIITIFIFSIWGAPYQLLMTGRYYLEFYAERPKNRNNGLT